MEFPLRMNFTLDKTIADRYRSLPQRDIIQLTYVWIDGTGESLRSKTRTANWSNDAAVEMPIWNFDGSSTGQASGEDSEICLKPVASFPDPFGCPNDKLVLCETIVSKTGAPTATNHRQRCLEAMKAAAKERPWFGMEQEYTLVDADRYPFGWPKHGFPAPQGPYYCGVGTGCAFGRAIVDSHFRACVYAGIRICGTNAEVMPGQWEYQVGTCEGIDMGDQLWMSRYILHRVAEDFGVGVSMNPKPVEGDWNGAGCHTNFSTEVMRMDAGIVAIMDACKKLSLSHNEHIAYYDPNRGRDNEKRLTGKHETASIRVFSYGVGDRSCSVRIPWKTQADGRGYLEDRRPSSNCDPYSVTAAIVRTVCLNVRRLSLTYSPNEREGKRERDTKTLIPSRLAF